MKSNFSLTEPYEMSQLSEIIIGSKAKAFCVIAISSYLIGVISSKTIMSANILSKTFKDIDVLGDYQFWVAVFFLTSSIFSFKDVSSTKIIQIFISYIRLICLLLFILGPIYISIRD
jgi:hypothetical protein